MSCSRAARCSTPPRRAARLYYGAADTCVGLMTANITDVLDWLRTQPSPCPTHD